LGTDCYGLFAAVDPIEFKRLLSNLITNAVEALDGAGSVVLKLRPLESEVELTIQDTGKGIPPQILSSLGRRGVSYGKAHGSGLGIYHAKNAIESWGGVYRSVLS